MIFYGSIIIRLAQVVSLLSILLMAGCSTGYFGNQSRVIARDDAFVIVQMGQESTRSLAKRYLGSESKYWAIEDANGPDDLKPGGHVVIPLGDLNPTGIERAGYQTVPILCYHRFGERGGKLEVSAHQFREQMQYLKSNGYRVIPLLDLLGFLEGKNPIPKRSVVLTIDDGHRSIYSVAFPILQEFDFPATIFLYTDYMDKGGLTTKELRAMNRSGLISIQPHSKTHTNLTRRDSGESKQRYLRRVDHEVEAPIVAISQKLGSTPRFYAYPFGATNEQVIDVLRERGVQMGLTVESEPNAAFTYPYTLHRSMIYGDRDLDAFIDRLVTFKSRQRE
ncbi:MAG: polysaccharide deacetylase family protein [Candidatus Thiodiazotropha sp.]